MSAQNGGQKAKIRRIMLALDAMHCEAALIEAAVLIASKLEAELDALFVEDSDVYAVADLPITHEISLGSARERAITGPHVEQALRCLSREAEQRFSAVTRRSRVKGEFQVTRARRGEALSDASARVELLLMQPRERTIVRVRIQETRPPRVFVLCGTTAASRRALELAARLAHQDHHVLEVIAAGEIDAAQLAEIEKTGVRVNLHPHPAGTDSLEMLREVENRLGNMLLIAGDLTPAKDRRAVLEELSHLRCQVLLVN
jgi:methylmalonyl-CoA mutase cobalamin-binding subunit